MSQVLPVQTSDLKPVSVPVVVPDQVDDRPNEPTAEQKVVSRLAVRSSAWTFVGQGGLAAMRLASNLILARLIVPDAFGVAAIVSVILIGLQMFSDFGLEPAIIRDDRGDDPKYLNTAWTIQAVRGVVLWFVSCLLAWPVAWFYAEPQFLALVPVAGLTAVVTGLFSTNMPRAKRSMQLARLTIVELTGQACGLVAMVAWALVSPTVWSLVVGGIVGMGARAALSHLVLRGPSNWFAWDSQSARSLLDFGKWIFLNSGLYFVSMHCDRLLVGRFMGMALFGVFSVAFALSQPAIVANFHLCRSVFLPVLSRTHRSHERQLPDVYYRYRFYFDLLLIPALGMLVALAPPVVHLLYDARYAGAGVMLQLLAVHAILCCLVEPGQSCLLAMGHPRYMTLAYVARLIWIIVALPVGWWLGGAMGVVVAVCLKETIVLIILSCYLKSLGILRVFGELRAVGMAVAGYACGSLLFLLLGSVFPGWC